MQQRTFTGENRSELPATLYPLPATPASTVSEAAYDQAPFAKATAAEVYPSPISEEALREHLPMVRFLALRIRERLPSRSKWKT